MDKYIEFSTTEMATICNVKRSVINNHCTTGFINNVKINGKIVISMTESELASYRAYHASTQHIESIAVSSDLFTIRDSTVERRDEVVLAAIFQAFAASNLTENPLVPWGKLMEVCKMLEIAPEDDTEKWLKNLVAKASTGKKAWCEIQYVMPEKKAIGLVETARSLALKHSESPEGYRNLTEAAEFYQIPNSMLGRWCKKGDIEGAKRLDGRKNRPWIIPVEWEPPAGRRTSSMTSSGPRMNKGAKNEGA